MNISEEQLKKIVLRVLKELEAEKAAEEGKKRQKLYMLCMTCWNEGYREFLSKMENLEDYHIYPVIPLSWQKKGYEAELRKYKACRGIVYRSCEQPQDLEDAVTVLPAVPRDVLVKTALCLSDTFETAWIAACLEKGSRVVFLRSGLSRFSGREQPAYVNRIMGYHRQILEYGIEICSAEELGALQCGEPVLPLYQPSCQPAHQPSRLVRQEFVISQSKPAVQGKKRVITSSNVETFASDGVLYLRNDDIVTDLAKERAKFLKIVFKKV